jgi:hypothetical protein
MAETNAEFLKTHVSRVEVVSFKDGIHNLELQKPEEVGNLILEFLNKSHPNHQNQYSDNQTPNPK